MIAPEASLAVTLKAADWNAVLAILAEAPYRIAGPLIGEIQRQCMQAAQTGAEVLPMRPRVAAEPEVG